MIHEIDIPGLSKNEALVYKTLLNLKEAGATKLSEKCGLFRTLVYDILTKLVEKGLASYINKSNKRVYRASSPNRLLELIKEKETSINNILPQLNAIFEKPKEECLVEQYDGKAGAKSIMEDMFESAVTEKSKEFLFFGSTGKALDVFDAYYVDIIKRVNKLKLAQKVDFRGIWSSKLKTDAVLKMIGKRKDHRFFPKGYEPTAPFIIYGDKVVIAGGINRHFAIVIQNKQIADSCKYYFEFMWSNALYK